MPNTFKPWQKEIEDTEKIAENYKKTIDELYNKKNQNNLQIDKKKKQNEILKDDNTIASSNAVNRNIADITLLERNNEYIEKQLDKMRLSYDNLMNDITTSKNQLNEEIEISNQGKIDELTAKLSIMNSRLSQTKATANETKKEIVEMLNQRKNSINLGKGFDDLGVKIDKFKNRMTRLIGTAMIFSLLRNQLTRLRNGFISLLKTDEGFSNSLNQIKANLMTAFAPIYNACLPAINALMNSLAKLTGTIAMFVANLFGTSIKDATKQAKGLSKALNDASKSGEDASGSLASFDKLEVIQDSSGGGGGDSSGINYDNEIQYSQRLLDFLNMIKDFCVNNKELVIGFLTGVAAGILAIKLGCDAFLALGIGLVIAGIVMLIQDIIKFLNDPTWEGFGKILTDIGVILLGLAVIIGSIPLAVAAAVALIVGLVIQNWNTICAVLGQVGDWIYKNVIKPIADFFTGLWNGIKDGVSSVWNFILNAFSKGGQIFNGLKDGIVNVFKAIVNTLITGINKIIATPFKTINGLLNTIRSVNIPVINVKPFKGLWAKNPLPVPKIPKLATGTVIPPRQEFMAILGDQKHGTNIEAPLDTIKQANREVMQEFLDSLNSLNNSEREIIFKNFTIVARFGNKDVAKVVTDAVRLSEKELGKQLFVS